MPNIVIREQDLSDVTSVNITENAVYVPGIASKGENNKPERFTSIDDFIDTFGSDSNAEEDLSFKYAAELISAGVPVYFEKLATLTSENLKTSIKNLTDRNAYNIKFISTGTFAVTIGDELFKTILETAATRGDCIALIDPAKTLDLLSIQTSLKTLKVDEYIITDDTGKEESTLKYGTLIAPWGTYATTNYGDQIFPGSFAYLTCLAKSTVNYPNWYAVAGVNRGYIRNLKNLEVDVTGATADTVQTISGISIVPITKINPYGYCIWGNRTLHSNSKEDLVASSFLNIRMLACDVKKTIYSAATQLMFETDSMQLWLDFKSKITPLLDKMVSGNGLTDYTISRAKTDKKATLKVVITLYCIEAVENFDVTLNITDSTVLIEE